MELVKELNYKKRDWRRDVGIITASFGLVLVSVDIWFQEFTTIPWWRILPVFVAVFVLHELAHGILFKIWTGKVEFGAGMTKFGPVFYAASPGCRLPRNRIIVVALAPQILSLLFFVLAYLPFIDEIHNMLIVAGVMNLSGGVGDFYSILQMLRYSKELQVEDSPTGMKFYMPEGGINENPEPIS